ncbi:phosphatase [Clostridium aminobutyricum]|uniref:Phosphatase n=1 Tax=Clostridium aminobutyricum TaxID=33953 RepID=A0A939IGZ3_CLOAM|nr:phosphatase [Clostridium aminobutyricum]MBN7774205.1 phosphatase [Clostridium aminobutyricum]
MMYGVIDIGSNTIRLSLYKKTDSSFKLMLNKKNMAGLAGHVSRNGNLSKKGIKKTIGILRAYRQILNNIEVKEVFVFATASLRNVKNTQEAIKIINEQTGFDIDLVSGEQEAIYDFVGATHVMNLDKGILIDIGGGSTELVFYSNGEIEKAVSLPIGSLSLYTKFVKNILPTKKELSKMKDCINDELKTIEISGEYQIICGVGGTIRGACKLNNEIFDMVSGNRNIEIKRLNEMLRDFSEERKYAVQKIIKNIPDRIHTIIPGMTILESISEKYNSETIVVSEYGIREGYLYTKLFLEGSNSDSSDSEQ